MANTNPTILELAQQIHTNSKLISDYLDKNSLPQPSLAATAYPFFPGTGPPSVDVFPRLNADIQDARSQLRDAAAHLLQLAAGPADAALNILITGHWRESAFQYAYHFRLAAHVPVDEDISYSDLAVKAGVIENQCTRILKMLGTFNFFRESRPGHVAHTAISKMLLVPDFRATLGYGLEESFLGGPKIVEAAEKYPGSQEKNETSWNLGHNIDLPMFEYFEQHPERMDRFMRHMRGFSSSESFSISKVVEAFDWKGLGKALVVDIGGSVGHVSFEIAEAVPDLEFIVQDLEKVVAGAQVELAGHKNIKRVKFQAHNFFTPQPVKNADVYLLRWICHDYGDKYAARILSNITSAMGPKGRIIIVDEVMPEVGTLSPV